MLGTISDANSHTMDLRLQDETCNRVVDYALQSDKHNLRAACLERSRMLFACKTEDKMLRAEIAKREILMDMFLINDSRLMRES